MATIKKRLHQIFSPVATKMHAATRINSGPRTANETLQEYIQIFADFVIQVMGTDPTALTFQVTIVLFIRHLLNKEMKKKQVAGAKTICKITLV